MAGNRMITRFSTGVLRVLMGDSNFLPHLVWVSSKKYVKIKGNKSPYDEDYKYWMHRFVKYKLNKSQQVLFKRQGSKCNLCVL